MKSSNINTSAALMLAGLMLGQGPALAQNQTKPNSMSHDMPGMDQAAMQPKAKAASVNKAASTKSTPGKPANKALARNPAMKKSTVQPAAQHTGHTEPARHTASPDGDASAAQPATSPHSMQGMPGNQGMENMPGMENHKGMHGVQSPQAAPAAPGAQSQQGAHDMHNMPGAQGVHGMNGQAAMPAAPGTKNMHGMNMGPMQGGEPPADARDPAAYAEGTTHAHLPGMDMNDDARFGRVIFNNLEFARGDGERGQNVEAEAWYGGDYNKLWLKAEGGRRGGKLDAMRTEALWDRTFATFWSTQLGIRHDTGGGPSRDYLAFGVRGLAPYWFDTEVTGYWGSGGQLAARAEVKYEVLFSPQLILQPEMSTNLYSKSDAARGIGTGLSDLELGLRLRYEIRRQFAPYIGVTWSRKFGQSADFARARGENRKSVQAVAGLRIWF